MGMLTRGGIIAIISRWASGLRFPWLFALTTALFVLNVLVPDAVPLVDEILLALGAVLLSGLKKKPDDRQAEADAAETPHAGSAPGDRN